MSQSAASSLEQGVLLANLQAQEQQLISHVRQLLYDEKLAPQVRPSQGFLMDSVDASCLFSIGYWVRSISAIVTATGSFGYLAWGPTWGLVFGTMSCDEYCCCSNCCSNKYGGQATSV
jgi:hypothetical protein